MVKGGAWRLAQELFRVRRAYLISTGLIPRSLLRYSGSYEPIYP